MIYIEVPDEFVEQRTREFKAEVAFPQDRRDETTPESYFREMVEGVADDMAFFGWPVTCTAQVLPGEWSKRGD